MSSNDLVVVLSRYLLYAVETGLDRRKRGLERRADLADDGDDGNADEGGDQAVFDRGCAGLTLHETGENVLHD